MSLKHATLRRVGIGVVFSVAGFGVLFTAACESADQRYARRMMWYRQPPKAAAPAHSLAVGRYGRDAEYGVWGPTGGVATAGNETGGASTGRYGASASFATWGRTDVGGEPISNGSISGRSGETGATLGVYGDTATVGEAGRGGATVGTTPR